MQKVWVLAFVLVLGALVASPAGAATNTESFSLAALFHLEDDGSTSLNNTVNETTKDETATGNNSEHDPVGENVTTATGPVDETDPATNESQTAKKTPRNVASMVSDGTLAGELPEPTVQKQMTPDEKPGDNDDEKNGNQDDGTNGGAGMQTQSGTSGNSPIGGGAALPVDPSGYFPDVGSMPEVGEKVQSALSLYLDVNPVDGTHRPTEEIVPGSFSPPDAEPGAEPNDLPGAPGSEEGGAQPMTQTAHSSQSATTGEIPDRNDPAAPNDPFRPSSPDRDDPPDSMKPKATTAGGVTPAESPLGSLPLALGVFAGLAVLALRPEIFLKPLQLLGLRLFTHIRKDAVLKHEKRNRIFTIIQQNPGIQAQELAESFGLPRNTVRYHVEVLCRHEKVVPFREGKKVFFYPADMVEAPEKFEEIKTIPSPIDQAIVQYLERSPEATQREIAAALGLHFALVSRRMGALAGKGIGVVQRNVMRG